ncbi:hypothetical protein MRY87_10600 [bacterium]|nr:hypothetical protein [bacterium]
MKSFFFSLILLCSSLVCVGSSFAENGVSTVINSVTEPYLCVVGADENILVHDHPRSGTRVIEFPAGRKSLQKKKRKLAKRRKSIRGKKRKKLSKKISAQKANLLGLQQCEAGTLAPALEFTTDTGEGTFRNESFLIDDIFFTVRFHQGGMGLTGEGSFFLQDNEQDTGQLEIRAKKTSTSEDGMMITYAILKGQLSLTGSQNLIDSMKGTVQVDYGALPVLTFTFSGKLKDTFTQQTQSYSFVAVENLVPFDGEEHIGDFDDDGDIDFADFQAFSECYTGPAEAFTDAACELWDTNEDGQVDFSDYTTLFSSGLHSGTGEDWSPSP